MDIFVSNLPFEITEQEITEAFASFGTVSAVKMLFDKVSGRFRGIAFVTMEQDSDGDTAIAELNGKDLGGRQMRVDRSRPREERFNGFGGGFDNRRQGNGGGGFRGRRDDFRGNGERTEGFAPRKSFDGRPDGRQSFDGRPDSKPSFGGRQGFGGKPSFGGRQGFGGKPSFGGRQGSGRPSFGDNAERPFRSNGGFKKRFDGGNSGDGEGRPRKFWDKRDFDE